MSAPGAERSLEQPKLNPAKIGSLSPTLCTSVPTSDGLVRIASPERLVQASSGEIADGKNLALANASFPPQPDARPVFGRPDELKAGVLKSLLRRDLDRP